MRLPHRALAAGLAGLMLLSCVSPVIGCGPWFTEPIFVFTESPDLPFAQFTSGKIGIVRPSLGRKTLVIAYRYLNGGSFTGEQQRELIDALNGKAPEEDSPDKIKAWIKARKDLLGEDQKLPQIYTERQYGGYDFFPNCTQNAFEVATETMKDRAATYGPENLNVKLWLDAQDTVFENCASGSHIPAGAGEGSPTWLRKDRDYQIAAAHFYSLNFPEARLRFEQIAADGDSPWRELAAYLVGRTLVREASLTTGEVKKRELYTQAETHLQTLISTGGKFAGASQKLLAMIKYHLHPEERVVELGHLLANGSDDNLRQDLIDYVWLLDKLEVRTLAAEEERKKKSDPAAEEEQKPANNAISNQREERYQKVQRGELIEVSVEFKTTGGVDGYHNYISLDFNPDVPETEILAMFEQKLNRQLTPEETKQVKEGHQSALATRQWNMSPNRKWGLNGMSQYEGCSYDCSKLTFDLLPEFFRTSDLSDWILTLQMTEPAAYGHALSRWRETGSTAWFVVALTKANNSSPRLAQLLRAADKFARDDPAFLTVAYHLVRLKAAIGQQDEARKLLDQILSAPSGTLPISSQNLFFEQRMALARGLSEFLQSAQRKPVAFSNEFGLGKISELHEKEKQSWAEYSSERKDEEYEREIDENYQPLLPWDDRFAFDDKTADIFNWHFPVQLLTEAGRNREIPDYLQRTLILAAWTRAIVLDKDDVALKIAPEVLRVAPEMSSVFTPYLKARTAKQRHNEALYVLLKFPNLSPYVVGGLPVFSTTEQLNYYLENAWWCPQPETDYDEQGNELSKAVPKPGFLTAEQLEAARRERLALRAIDNGKSYLGKQVIEWAKNSPLDVRVPEALFIAVKANQRYKYGCDGWTYDEETRSAAEKILRQRYEQSPWTAKLRTVPDQ
jgi:hypothetical protein